MREPYSPAVERLLAIVGIGADTDVYLRAMLDEGEGRVATLLAQHGLDAERIDWPDSTDFLRTEQALVEARRLSRERDTEGTVTSEFLLFAILESDASLLDALAQAGLDYPGLRQQVFVSAPVLIESDMLLLVPDHVERLHSARIVDVNLNRSLEALRVLDDYARFVRDDPHLTGEIKHLRHELAALTGLLPAGILLHARDTVHDVGTSIVTEGERTRSSPAQVAGINVHRLQESLRSLEEYGKLLHGGFAAGVEQIRYKSYTLEKLLRCSVHPSLTDTRLYVLLSASTCSASIEWTIAEAAAGGATAFQLREKSLDDRELLARARRIRQWTRQVNALYIVNDRPDVALLAEADGVHLGQDDISLRDARLILGEKALIGVSTHSLDQVHRAIDDGADYIGIGPTFASTTKSFGELAGLEFVKAASLATSLPAFAIGGINVHNIAQVVEAGVRRVAVSAAIAQADDPRKAAQLLRAALPSEPLS